MDSRKTVLLPERNLVGNHSDWLKIVDVIGNSRWHLSWSLGYRRRLSMWWIVLRKPMARPKTEATQQRTLLVKSMLENIWTHIHESILGSIFDSENMFFFPSKWIAWFFLALKPSWLTNGTSVHHWIQGTEMRSLSSRDFMKDYRMLDARLQFCCGKIPTSSWHRNLLLYMQCLGSR